MGFSPAKAALLGAAFAFLAAGCATVSADLRQTVLRRAGERGFIRQSVSAGPFDLAAFVRRSGAAPILKVYVEGDGAPWSSPWHPPRDPTPLRPIALALAIGDPSPAVAYLGRPCQYLDPGAHSRCDVAWWSNRRFDRDVVDAFDEALTRLKAETGAQRLHLHGHSGGGVIAALLAFRRKDVDRLVTIAAPLALAKWTAWHEVTPFPEASDPVRQPGLLPLNIHWVGGRDETVPPAIVDAFVRVKGGRMMNMPDHDHECCWARDWPRLLEETK